MYAQYIGAVSLGSFNPGIGPVFFVDVRCTGEEPNLNLCDHALADRGHPCERLRFTDVQDAGVRCLQGIK